MIRIRNKRNRISLLRFILFACAIFAMIGCFSVAVYANTRTERVRIMRMKYFKREPAKVKSRADMHTNTIVSYQSIQAGNTNMCMESSVTCIRCFWTAR